MGSEVVRTLHTAVDAEYLNEEEKKVILFMNMARHDGPLFAETFLNHYVEENQIWRVTRYVKSLIRDLNKITGLAPPDA